MLQTLFVTARSFRSPRITFSQLATCCSLRGVHVANGWKCAARACGVPGVPLLHCHRVDGLHAIARISEVGIERTLMIRTKHPRFSQPQVVRCDLPVNAQLECGQSGKMGLVFVFLQWCMARPHAANGSPALAAYSHLNSRASTASDSSHSSSHCAAHKWSSMELRNTGCTGSGESPVQLFKPSKFRCRTIFEAEN